MFDTFVRARSLRKGDMIALGKAAGLFVDHVVEYGDQAFIHLTNGTVIRRRPDTKMGILRERESV